MAVSSTKACSITMMVMIMMMMVPSMDGRVLSDKENLRIDSILKSMNKPAVKTIKDPYGDIIDCVHIIEQPTLDHPLLKDHTIQMWPSFLSKENAVKNISKKGIGKGSVQIWHSDEECPDNTVPIRRIRRSDILRFKNIDDFGKKPMKRRIHSNHPDNDDYNDDDAFHHEYAVIESKVNAVGTVAIFDVWNPKVARRNEFSVSQLWVIGGNPDADNYSTLEAGFTVYPQIYNDRRTRFTIFWTADNYNDTGCFNLNCQGFVHTNKKIPLGGVISRVSTYADTRYAVTIRLSQDPLTHHWWLFVEEDPVGYWPEKLVPVMYKGATEFNYGGEIINSRYGGHHTWTFMGNGHFAESGLGKAAMIGNIFILDETFQQRPPPNVKTFASNASCYNVLTGTDDVTPGVHMFFGGPGYNTECP